MINFEQLKSANFKKHGNWWIKGNISVNLISGVLFHTQEPKFQIEVGDAEKKDMTLEDVKIFSNIMKKLTGYRGAL